MKKRLLIGCICLFLLTAAAGIWFRSIQEEADGIMIRNGDKEITVSCDFLEAEIFTGELVNGKGEKNCHEYKGIKLSELLEMTGMEAEDADEIEVTSADNYTATFNKEELLEDGKMYLAISIDGQSIEGIDEGTQGVQLIVFGDSNSRRCVRYVKSIQILQKES